MESQYGRGGEDEELLAGGGVHGLLLPAGGVGVVQLPLVGAGLAAPLVGPGEELGLGEVVEAGVDGALPRRGLVPGAQARQGPTGPLRGHPLLGAEAGPSLQLQRGHGVAERGQARLQVTRGLHEAVQLGQVVDQVLGHDPSLIIIIVVLNISI